MEQNEKKKVCHHQTSSTHLTHRRIPLQSVQRMINYANVFPSNRFSHERLNCFGHRYPVQYAQRNNLCKCVKPREKDGKWVLRNSSVVTDIVNDDLCHTNSGHARTNHH